MEVGKKTLLTGGIIHCRPDEMSYQQTDIYGALLARSPIFEGDHDVRSAFFKMKQGDSISVHEHRKWVQVAVLSGSLRVEQGNTPSFIARPRDVYFLDPGHPHTETALEDSLVLVTQGEDRAGWTTR